MSELRKRYRENYEKIAKDLFTVSQEARTIASLVGYDLRRMYYICPIPKIDVVDIGCGKGWVTKDLTFADVVNTDTSINQVKAVSGKKRMVADAEVLPLKDSVADVVVCTDVLEHVLDPKKMANEITRILRPKGVLLLAVPWQQDLSVYNDPRYKHRYEFVHLRSINDQDLNVWFPTYVLRSWTNITNQCPEQWAPYTIKYLHLEKKA